MRYLTTAVLGTLALAILHCSDGSGNGSTTGSGSGGATSGAGTGGSGASPVGTGGTGGTGGTTGSGGAPTTGSGGSSSTGTGGTGEATGSGGASGSDSTGTGGTGGGSSETTTTGSGGSGGSSSTDAGGGGAPRPDAAAAETGTSQPGALKKGPFKILLIRNALDYAHASIADGLQLVKDLGASTDADLAKNGAAAGNTWTVDEVAPGKDTANANYLAEITAANLKNYELVYSDNPTGKVFTNAPNSAQKKQAFQDYMDNGGAWAGQHSATDFENNNSWTWFQDNVDGGWFTDHDNDTSLAGTIAWESTFANHPILKGLPSPWNAQDEWYIMNRNIEAVPGFQILGKVTVPTSSKNKNPRPAIWIHENPKGGRSFYTIRGHNPSVYKEPQFRSLMLRGILWAVHRL